MPRFMILITADPMAETLQPPPAALLEEMTTFNEQLNAAGVLLAGEGFRPTSDDSYRITFHPSSGSGTSTTTTTTVTPGPFDVGKETHVCGFWILKTKDAEEALGWVNKIPFHEGGEVVMRKIAEMEDFGDEMGSELRERERKMGEDVARRAAGQEGK